MDDERGNGPMTGSGIRGEMPMETGMAHSSVAAKSSKGSGWFGGGWAN